MHERRLWSVWRAHVQSPNGGGGGRGGPGGPGGLGGLGLFGSQPTHPLVHVVGFELSNLAASWRAKKLQAVAHQLFAHAMMLAQGD